MGDSDKDFYKPRDKMDCLEMMKETLEIEINTDSRLTIKIVRILERMKREKACTDILVPLII